MDAGAPSPQQEGYTVEGVSARPPVPMAALSLAVTPWCHHVPVRCQEELSREEVLPTIPTNQLGFFIGTRWF